MKPKMRRWMPLAMIFGVIWNAIALPIAAAMRRLARLSTLFLLVTGCADPAAVGDAPRAPDDPSPPLPIVFDRGGRDAQVDASPTDAGMPEMGAACDGCRPFECIPGLDGQPMCTTLCDPVAPDCPCGFECRFLNNTGADATWLCAPREHRLCTACANDADCAIGENGARCLDEQGGRFCGLGCADGCCPAGFECIDAQCRPAGAASCAACQDSDGDGYGQGDGCAGPDCNDRDVNVHPQAPERCNAQDDDCDARIDEALGDAPIDCPAGGICAGTPPECVAGEWRCELPPGYEAVETRCDGLDNDCDGLVDNLAGRGEPCEVGEGGCAAPGVMICDDAIGSLRCAAEPLAPVAELCNGIDDDCDGVLDEVDGAGERCEHGAGVCRTAGELLCDPARGELVCSAPVVDGQPERCDNRDNDCDGVIDEGLRGCLPEQCNGQDDDLDGAIDEDVTRPCESACGPGDARCIDGAFDACDAPQPAVETCNGRDDDCDGLVDEALVEPCFDGPAAVAGECRAGQTRCRAGQWQACVDQVLPAVERCDGLDNDCDGSADEGFAIGDPCTAGMGACAREGVHGCVDDALACLAEPGPQAGEDASCDGLDQDCDGRVDEAWQSDAPDCGVGACRANRVAARCVDGAPRPCQPGMPQAEVCNAIDDDCDGQTDEGVLNACGQCGPAPAEECNGEDDDCDGRADENLSNRCGGCGPEPDETCNNNDDDCDGRVDEGVERACQSACGDGVERCAAGAFGACDAPQPRAEICDGVDDDCDGRTDEGTQNACGQCGPAPAEACNNADDDCDGRVDEGTLNRCGRCGPEPAEVCNGRDDDCDGQSDEGVANRCGRCGPEPAEVCNGRDDDCDGQTDEALRRACQSACGAGEEQCVVGRWRDCNAPQPQVERCDSADNDCDGRTDEGTQNACGQCGPLPDEVCNHRDDDCDGRVDERVLNNCGQCGPEPRETCNRQDDDCDGRFDEGVQNRCGDCGPEPNEVCNGRDDDCDGRTDERVENRCGGCGPEPDEICNGRDDDCDGRVDEGNGLCGGSDICTQGRCCDDDDRDGHARRGCGGGDDCDDNDPYKHPGRREVLDIRDNDCDGNADNLGLRRLNRYYRAWNRNDWEHRFATRRPAGFESENPQHYIELYPLNVCRSSRSPDDRCDYERVAGDARSSGTAIVRLRHGVLRGLMQCTGVLGQHHISLLLGEDSREYRDYRDERPRRLSCERIGYVYGGVTWRNVVGGVAGFYRHRSPFGAPGKGDNMWSTEPREGHPTYDRHSNAPVFYTKGGF